MKKINLIILIVLTASILVSCAAPTECEYEKALEAVRDAETVSVYVYDEDDSGYEVTVCDEFLSLLDGKYTECDGKASDKIVTVSISDNYEISYCDNGNAVIFYGTTGLFQSDRKYYEYSLDNEADSIVEYAVANGTLITDETESESEGK